MADRPLKTRTLYTKPQSNVFAGRGKYLRMQKVKLTHAMYPVTEEDSLFIYVRSGRGQIMINGVVFDLAPRTFCWIQYYQVFTLEPELGSELELEICVYDYHLSSYLIFFEREIANTNAVMQGLPVLYLDEEKDRLVRSLLDEFAEESDSNLPGSALIKVSILGLLDRFFCNELVQTDSKLPFEPPLGWNLCLYTMFQCANPIDADTVAAYYGVSTATLNHELKLATGMNFSQLLNRTRIHKALSAMLFDGLSFYFLASYSGFKSEVVFFRTFKKLMGMTPQEYRDSITTDNPYIYRTMVTSESFFSIINHIYSNFSEPISIKSMERDLYISENVIRNLLQENIGMTYKGVLDMFRIRYSEALLTVTDLPVVDVAVAAGFNSVRTFMRVFKERNGLSPSVYRKKYKKEVPL